MNRTMRFLAALALALAAAPALAQTIKIGLMAPLTGPWASEGQEMRRNVELLAGLSH